MKQYLQLFLNSVQKKSQRPGKCFAVAFTSYMPEEGVSYVAQSFGVEIAKKTGKRTLIADARRLSQINIMHYSRVAESCFPTDVPNLWTLPEEDVAGASEENFEEMPGEALYLQAYGDSPMEIAFN